MRILKVIHSRGGGQSLLGSPEWLSGLKIATISARKSMLGHLPLHGRMVKTNCENLNPSTPLSTAAELTRDVLSLV